MPSSRTGSRPASTEPGSRGRDSHRTSRSRGRYRGIARDRALPLHAHPLSVVPLREGDPNIDLDAPGLRVPSVCEPWPSEVEPIAGGSSFGFGGTNAHAVLSAPAPDTPGAKDATEVLENRPGLLPVSAPSRIPLPTRSARRIRVCATSASRRPRDARTIATDSRSSGGRARSWPIGFGAERPKPRYRTEP